MMRKSFYGIVHFGILFLASLSCLRASSKKMMKVLIKESPQFFLAATGTFRLKSLKTGQTLLQKNYLSETLVSKGQGRTIRVEGVKDLFEEGIVLESEEKEIFSIDTKRYRGSFSIRVSQDSKNIQIFNHLAIEDYVKGVVGSEIPYYWPETMLKVQAIMARSYVYFQFYGTPKKDFLMANTRSQMYLGLSAEMPATNSAVDKTKGMVLLFRKRLFPTFYHSQCAGQTEAARDIWDIDMIPLRGVKCPYCSESMSDFWKVKIHENQIEKILKRDYSFGGEFLEMFRIAKRSPSGRVSWIEIINDHGEKMGISGNSLRLKLGETRIKSTKFDFYRQNHFFYFQGNGFGHGVGLCQRGAKAMAKKKRASVKKILQFYFPYARLGRYTRDT